MKSFQYTAKNAQGEKVSGVINSSQFEDASNQIRSKGLELISLEEVEQDIIEHMRPSVFEAIDKQRAEKPGTITVPIVDEDDDDEADPERTPEPQPERSESTEDHILFSDVPQEEQQPTRTHHELDAVEHDIDYLLKEKGELLSDTTRERLLHLAGKIDLLRESPDKRRLKNFKREMKKAMKIAQRELKEADQEKWESYEQAAPGKKIESYAEFEQERKQQKIAKLKTSKLSKWLQVVDLPNEDCEEEVLVKQQYESVWNEIQRFAAALFCFYIAVYFIAYYLKRAGVEDHFLVRIYDTTLFKQLVVILFGLFALLTTRINFLPARIKSDALVVVLWLATVWWVMW